MAIVSIEKDEESVAASAAERITSLIEEAIATRRSAVVCLTGGHTPQRLYELLADSRCPWRNRIDWARLHLFWGDERHVPPDHPDSNFGMAFRALVARVPIPAGQVYRIHAELPDASAAAREYETALRDGFVATGRADETFDVMLLGLGEDAHIASIFPGNRLLDAWGADPSGPPGEPPGGVPSAAAAVEGQWRAPHVSAVWAEHLSAWRITLTPPALLDARTILMIVSGKAKAGAVRAALELPLEITRWPAQLLRAAGDRVEWITDAAAAAQLRGEPRA